MAARAQRGDIVRNLTTGRIGEAADPKQDGRINVCYPNTSAPDRVTRAEERYNLEVVAERLN